MRTPTIIAALLLVTAAPAAAEAPPPICADRPGRGTSACTVPQGMIQIETGLADWTLQKRNGERDTSLALGQTTFKYGLTARSDIEISVTPFERTTRSAGGVHESARGFGDTNIIYKQQLTSPDAAVQLVLYPFVKIPTAPRSLGNGQWEGGLKIPIGYAIPKSPLSIGLTPELDWVADGDGHGHHALMVQVASFGWAVNDKLNLGTEIWGQWDWDPAGTTHQVSADGTIAYLVSKNVQLDAGTNIGLNRQTPDVELYGGVSVRF